MRNKPGSDLLPDGEYDATIMAGEDGKKSKAGNEMMELVLAVYDREGKDVAVTDYIVATPKMQWKIRHLCEAVGVEYERDDLPVDDFVGANVRVKVVTQVDEEYGPQNRIQDYLKTNGARPAKAKADDEIPF